VARCEEECGDLVRNCTLCKNTGLPLRAPIDKRVMESYHFDNLSIILDKTGSVEFGKVSYPIRYGRFSEIKTRDYTFQCNLNGEIKYIQGRGEGWPHPAEWLKRTVGNDWVYYSAGEYGRAYDCFGEYYLPCLSYPTNSIMGGNPFNDGGVGSALEAWEKARIELKGLRARSLPQGLEDFLSLVIEYDAKRLQVRAHVLHKLIGGPITVLPPDTRHVDYEIIPVIIADGCLYNCAFCRVKTGDDFALRDKKSIVDQIKRLKAFYSHDLRNYNAVFLGQHDALNAGEDLIEFAASKAYEILGLNQSHMNGAYLYLFGSVDSLLKARDGLFEMLHELPFRTYVNLGLESADQETLTALGKPIASEMIGEAFARMLELNRQYERIEVTANFLLGSNLPQGHLPNSLNVIRNQLNCFYSKGAIYFSPLVNGTSMSRETRRTMRRRFGEIKSLSLLPTYLYLIQRL
jgi:hypothetical protein